MSTDFCNDADYTRHQIAKAVEKMSLDLEILGNPSLKNLDTIINEVKKGEVVVTFTANANTVQGNGVVGGGTLANMLDNALAIAVMTELETGTLCSTVSLTIQMMRGATPGQFTAKAQVEKIGRKIAFAQAKLFDASERIIASASSSFAIVKI